LEGANYVQAACFFIIIQHYRFFNFDAERPNSAARSQRDTDNITEIRQLNDEKLAGEGRLE
jgi:hypothetical protein